MRISSLLIALACCCEVLDTPRAASAAGPIETASEVGNPRLRNLRRVNDRLWVPQRDVLMRWPLVPTYDDPGRLVPNRSYVLNKFDVIEFSLLDPTSNLPVALPRLTVAMNRDSTVEILPIIEDVRFPRLPFWVACEPIYINFPVDSPMPSSRGLKLFPATTGLPFPTFFDTSAFALNRTVWGDIVTAFQDKTVTTKDPMDATAVRYKLAVRLIPVTLDVALPGDTLFVRRIATRASDAEGDKDQTVSEYSVQVDQDGYISLPPITSAVAQTGGRFPFYDPATIEEGLTRRLHNSIDNAGFRILVAAAGDPLPLLEIADILGSLSNQTGAHAPSDSQRAEWRKIGLDDQSLPKSGFRVRYQLELQAPRTWKLVDESGRTTESALNGRSLLIETVRDVYRRATGRELLSGRDELSRAFVTVVPRGSDPIRDAPFWGRLDVGDPYGDLKYISLERGDTVFISRKAPTEDLSSLP